MIYLTQNYKELFNLSGWKFIKEFVKRFPFLIKDIIRSGKVNETFSFILWEIIYCCKNFNKSSYLKFNSQEPIRFNFDDDNNYNMLKDIKLPNESKFKIEISQINWKVLLIDLNKDVVGVTLQNPNILILSTNRFEYEFLQDFGSPVESIFQAKNGYVFVCIRGKVFRTENYRDFELCLTFKHNNSIFRHDCGMTENEDGLLYIGEYGSFWDDSDNWKFLAFLYISDDMGLTWHVNDFLKNAGVNKHIHLVKYFKRLNHLVLTDGDNHKFIWKSDCNNTNNSLNNGWEKINRFHIQKGGFTSGIETSANIIFGSDYLGGTNFIIKTEDLIHFKSEVLPPPYKRNAVSALALRKNKIHDEIWAEITSLENFINCKGLIMYSDDNGISWNKFIEFFGKYQDVTIISSDNSINEEIYILVRPTDKTDKKSFTLRVFNAD